jgi:hypothetical protein
MKKIVVSLLRVLFDFLPKSIKPNGIRRKLTRDMVLDISWRQNNDHCSQSPILMVCVEDINPWSGRVEYARNYLTVL